MTCRERELTLDHIILFSPHKDMEGLPDEGSAQCLGHLRDSTNIKDDTHQAHSHSCLFCTLINIHNYVFFVLLYTNYKFYIYITFVHVSFVIFKSLFSMWHFCNLYNIYLHLFVNYIILTMPIFSNFCNNLDTFL